MFLLHLHTLLPLFTAIVASVAAAPAPGSVTHNTSTPTTMADNTTVQPSASPTAAFLPIVIFMDANDVSQSVSAKVTFGIIFGIILFVGLNLALFCLWNNRCRSSRSPKVLPPPRRHIELTVSSPWHPSYPRPSYPRPSYPRSSSAQTMVPRASNGGDGSSVKGSEADGQSLELVTSPAHARAPSRPRVPLIESGARAF